MHFIDCNAYEVLQENEILGTVYFFTNVAPLARAISGDALAISNALVHIWIVFLLCWL